MSEKNGNDEVKFEITEHIGIVKTYPTGWSKELNIVSWNGAPAKYDIRDWDHKHERMSRGITLHGDEIKKVVELLEGRRFD